MNRLKRLFVRGCQHSDRWNETHSLADLDCAIACFRELDPLIGDDHWLRPGVDGYLGLCLAAQLSVTGSIEAGDEAIDCLTRLIAWPDPDGDWDGARLVLGELLASRATGDWDAGNAGPHNVEQWRRDLESAINLLTEAVGSTNLEAGPRAEGRGALVRAIAWRALRRSWDIRSRSGVPDLEELRAARRDIPEDDPLSPALLLELGVILGERATVGGSSDDRRQAVEYLTEALRGVYPDNPQRGLAQTLLASLLLIGNGLTDVGGMPAAQILAVSEQALSEQGRSPVSESIFGPEMPALHHLLAAQAYLDRARQDGSRDDDKVLAHLNEAKDLVPEDHVLQPALLAALHRLLGDRFTATGAIDEHDAANAYLGAMYDLAERHDLTEAAGVLPDELRRIRQALDPAVIRGQKAFDRLDTAFHHRQLASVDLALADLDQALAAVPADNWFRHVLVALLGQGWLRRAELCRTGPSFDHDAIHGLRLLVQAGEQGDSDDAYHRNLATMAASAQAQLGVLTKDSRLIDDAIPRLAAAAEGTSELHGERASVIKALGLALIERHILTGNQRDRNDGILKLEEARRATRLELGREDFLILWRLAESYHARGDRSLGDRERAAETGLLALRERAADVLLQSGAERSLARAADVSLYAGLLVFWCLAAGRLDQAVAALELSRAMVLHTTTTAADVPGLLRAAGQDGLATSWQQEVSKRAPAPWDGPLRSLGGGTLGGGTLLPGTALEQFAVPAGIRSQVLAALRGTAAEAELLTPPTVGELASALSQTGSDAFVYLIPPRFQRPGCALVLRADGGLIEISLPLLADDPIEAYDAAHQASIGAPGDEAASELWHSTLADLCDWAWEAVTGPVLAHAAQWGLPRLPRLVLIPTGKLGAVPWHAARRRGACGRPHYAIQDAVLTYAASARQLAAAARRQDRPWGDRPVLVSNPTGDLHLAGLEAQELLRRYYPGALFLGRPKQIASGTGTPDEVLARLPGGSAPTASLLHCGCHATVAGSLSSSYLLLAGGQQLTIARVVAQAQGRDPQAPGFLAVLGACMSDLADVDHEEALTLASALLAAGAFGVVGARWPTDDLATSQLMVMFHHFINSGHTRPADALRAAQLWMLDPARRGLEGLPSQLADATTDPSLGEIHAWAAFTYQGT